MSHARPVWSRRRAAPTHGTPVERAIWPPWKSARDPGRFDRVAAGAAARMGDMDGDYDLDCADLTSFAACMTGPAEQAMDPDCGGFDVSGNAAVDLADFAVLQTAFNTCAAPPGFTQIKTAEELNVPLPAAN